MPDAAPRIGPPLLAAIEWLDDEAVPIAEISRRVAALAGDLGLARPSYEQSEFSSTSIVGAAWHRQPEGSCSTSR